MISIKGLSHSYPGSETVLKNISAKIKPGEIVSIIGKSGCGKSTLLLSLNGMIPKSLGGKMSGKIMVNDKDIKHFAVIELKDDIQLMFQNPETQFFSFSVEDEIRFGLENLGLEDKEINRRITEVTRLFRIKHLLNRSPEELSSGEKQLVILAALVAMRPKVLVLDEPTANLDPVQTMRLIRIIKQLRAEYHLTILIAEHSFDFIKISDRVLMMNNGKLEKWDGKVPKHEKHLIDRETKKDSTIEIKGLHYWYGDRPVLGGVDMTINKQDFVGIVGFNGCGKSTLALNMAGLLKSSRGEILINGLPIKKNSSDQISFVFQNPEHTLFENTVLEELMFGPKNMGFDSRTVNKRISETLEALELKHLEKEDPHNLSLGEKRRVTIASVLTMRPSIIIVDEPDTGLDFSTGLKLMHHLKKINETGTTVIIISHNLELVDGFCNKKFFLDKGRIGNISDFYSAIDKEKNEALRVL